MGTDMVHLLDVSWSDALEAEVACHGHNCPLSNHPDFRDLVAEVGFLPGPPRRVAVTLRRDDDGCEWLDLVD